MMAQLAAAAELIRVEPGGDAPGLVIVENAHFRMAVDPARGASVVSFITKPANTPMLLPDATHGAGLLADVFRDEGFAGQWRGAYEVKIVPPGTVVFERRGTGTGPVTQITVSKTLTVTADSPAIDVTTEVRMAEGEHRQFAFRYSAHNRVGREKPGVMQYFLPSLKGVRSYSFAASEQSGSQQHTVTDPPHPWLAVAAESGEGMAIRFAEPHPRTLYSYLKNKIATLEWSFDQHILRRGQSRKSSFRIQTFAGLPRVDGVFDDAIGAVVVAENAPASGRVLLTGAAGACEVKVQYRRLPVRTWTPLGDMKATISANRVIELPFSLPGQGDGSYVVSAELYRDGRPIGAFERLIEIGEPSGRYVVMPLNPKTDQLGPTARDGAIAIKPGEPVLVEKVIPLDSRLVRGFAHAPFDGRTDTRNSDDGINEWNGSSGVQGVNYIEFNENNGLHVALPDGGFDAIIARGGWLGKVYADRDGLMPPSPDAPMFLDVQSKLGVFRRHFPERVAPKQLSFFYTMQRGEPLADLTFLRIKRGGSFTGSTAQTTLGIGDLMQPDDVIHQAMEARYSPFYRAHQLQAAPAKPVSVLKGEFIHLFAPPQQATEGVAAVSLELDIAGVEPGALLTVRVQDVLDPRREVMGADFQVAGPGRYVVTLDAPDQVFLPPRSQWARQPRIDGEITPQPVLWLSVAFDAPAEIRRGNVTLHHVTREQALPQAGAWRKFLLRGQFATMSEPRPWMNLTDDKPIRQQIAENEVFKRYRPSLTELLETVEIARQVLPDDDIVRQYHEWLYQNLDRRKPLPPPVLPAEIEQSGAPRWAALVRQTWIEQRDMVEWWLANRLVPGGLFGGGLNDDTDLFQTWQCLPMIESHPLGARMRDAAIRLADLAWETAMEEGLNKRSMDALHAYEEGINHIAMTAWWEYGDPIHFERAMITAASTRRLMVETPDGRLHIGGETLGIDQARSGFAKPGNAGGYATKLFMHPLYEVTWYNRNPAALKTFEQWGKTWADYQQPGAFVEYVDITTGKPLRTTAYSRGPTDEWLALYHVTGDPQWLAPLKMGIKPGDYWGFQASYGRSAHALIQWGEPVQTQMREQFSAPGHGYASFFLNKDRNLLDKWLADSASWFGRYRHMYTAAEQKTDRLLTYNASTPISCYLGDAPNRNRWVHYNAVSYEGLRGEDFAALVWDAAGDKLRVAIYNFSNKPLTGTIRTWRLDHGRFRLRIGADTNDDGSIDSGSEDREVQLMRGSRIAVTLPPRQVTVVNVEQIEQLDDIRTRADLALSERHTAVAGNSVSGIVHNIGSASADVTVAVLDAAGKVLVQQSLGKLDAPLDLNPRHQPFTLQVPGGVKPGHRLVVDPAGGVPEIYEENNSILLLSGKQSQ